MTLTFPTSRSAVVIGSTLYSNGEPLAAGLPVSYTVSDITAGETIAVLVETAGEYGTCVLASEGGGNRFRFVPEPIFPYHACSGGEFGAPGADALAISGSFAGNEKYGPSQSPMQPFP